MSSPYETKDRVVMHVFCEDCGAYCHPCDYCNKRTANSLSGYCKDCYRDFGYAGQMFYPDDPKVKPEFVCFPCQEERDNCAVEVYNYEYIPADSSKPLLPTNVYRYPMFRKVGEGTTCPLERADEAIAAYEHEMKFSGDEAEAKQILRSFYNRKRTRIPDPKALREGFVSMEEILNGQHVTGEQFFNALRDTYDKDMDDEFSYVGNNPKTMSDRQLNYAYKEVCEDRKDLCRSCRRGWTPDDEALMDAMDDWAKLIFDEMQARGQ